jgi:hypothetical protein
MDGVGEAVGEPAHCAERSEALEAAAAWSEWQGVDRRRKRLGVLLVVVGLGLMASGGWLVFAG